MSEYGQPDQFRDFGNGLIDLLLLFAFRFFGLSFFATIFLLSLEKLGLFFASYARMVGFDYSTVTTFGRVIISSVSASFPAHVETFGVTNQLIGRGKACATREQIPRVVTFVILKAGVRERKCGLIQHRLIICDLGSPLAKLTSRCQVFPIV